MKRTLPLWLLPALLCAFSIQAYAAGPKYIQGYISKISDGDTVHVTPASRQWEENGFSLPALLDGWGGGAKRLKVRMVGMDTPESHLPVKGGVAAQVPWGEWATQGLKSVLKVGDPVTLAHYGFDVYGRVLGIVYKGKNDVNLWMVRAGFANPYVICSGRTCNRDFFRVQKVRDYLAACDAARTEGRGIWNPSQPLKELPFEFRLRKMKRKPNKWVGNYSTRRLVEPDQYKRVDVCRRIFFMDKREAHRVGFR